MSGTPRIECQASLRKKPQCGDSLSPAPQLPGLSLVLGEFRSNSRKPQLEVPWRVGCKGDMEAPPLRRSFPGGQLSELLCTQDSTVPLETSCWQSQGASRAPEPGVQFCNTLGGQVSHSCGMPARGWTSAQPRGHQEDPSTGSLLLSPCFLNLWRGSRPSGTEVEGVLLFPRYLLRCLTAAQGPAPLPDELDIH